ncbi:MAG: ABC transporter permease [Sedimentisphaerales bacterium]|nr:ABC transporter permease [Sedimentisphaerales bacterium]
MNSIWAVAKNTIKQALRMKIAVVFIILLLALLPVLGVSTTGDETIKGRLQTFISYGLSLTSFLLCLLTIAISIYTVTNDIKEKQIFTIITKPIRRFEFLTGKLLGVILLDMLLLVIFSIIIYSIAVYMPKFYQVNSVELAQAKTEFFTARAALVIPQQDFTEQARERFNKLKAEDALPENMSPAEVIREINNQMQVLSRAADIGDGIEWEFENVKPLADSIFIRFKYEVLQETPDSRIYSRWVVGDPHSVRTGEPGKTPVFVQDYRHTTETFHEIEIPSEVIPESGKLAVVFYNYPSNDTVVMFPKDGMEVLFKADNFTMNFIRSVILILSRLVFLTCLGILTSTFLSFPVAILLCLVLFVTASFSGFVLESFDFLSRNVGILYTYTLKWIVQILPEFDKYNPTKFLVPARLLSWSFVGQCILFMVCIKSFLLLVLAFLIFTYREIAKIVV